MGDYRFSEMAKRMISILGISEGEKVLIRGHTECEPLMSKLIIEARKAGAFPAYELMSENLYAGLLRSSDEESYRFSVDVTKKAVEDSDVIITLFAAANDYDLGSIDPEKVRALQAMDFEYISVMVSEKKWLLFNYPTELAAYKAKMSTVDYANMTFDSAAFDFSPYMKEIKALKSMIDSAEQVSVKDGDTDFVFSKEGIGSVPCTGRNNLPDGEIYTSPKKGTLNGRVIFNTMSSFMGQEFSSVDLKFVSGRAVSGIDAVNEIMKTDDGASQIGEIAFGLNPFIRKVTGDTLLDEKILGSFHMALGNSFIGEADNGNRSLMHWDLVHMMSEECEIRFDDKLIIKGGRFIPEGIKELNRLYDAESLLHKANKL